MMRGAGTNTGELDMLKVESQLQIWQVLKWKSREMNMWKVYRDCMNIGQKRSWEIGIIIIRNGVINKK